MIAKRIENLAPSGIREFFDLVLGMPEVISLGVGEPDFITPWRVREKAITAIEDGFTSYTSNKGLFRLREKISSHLKGKYNLRYNPSKEILITIGVSEGLDLAIRAVMEPRDYAVVVSPYYVAYPGLTLINYGRVIYLRTKEEEGFKINPGKLKEALKLNPKVIILNYPSNPTGATYTLEELKEIWKVISKKEIVVITDEIYDELTYEGEHYPFASLNSKAKNRAVLLNGFSKGYAMTGFRVGYACGNEKIIEAMTKIHSYSALCGPIVSQIAAMEAFSVQKEVKQMVSQYKTRRDFTVSELNKIGLRVAVPRGAFYCFPSLDRFNINAMDFAKRLLFEEKVAVVPGTAFGVELSSYIRISYANSIENLKEALVRIKCLLSRL